jgi:hypothetical protein
MTRVRHCEECGGELSFDKRVAEAGFCLSCFDGVKLKWTGLTREQLRMEN